MSKTYIGTIRNNHTVIEVHPVLPTTSNRKLTVQCNNCNVQTIQWNSNLRSKTFTCQYCKNRTDYGKGAELTDLRPLIVRYPDGDLVFHWNNSTEPHKIAVPEGATLLVVRSRNRASPYIEGEDLTKPPRGLRAPAIAQTAQKPVPAPDPRYRYLITPARYMPYLTGQSDAFEEEALAFFEKHVKPNNHGMHSELSACLTDTWTDGEGVERAYLYFLDDLSEILP